MLRLYHRRNSLLAGIIITLITYLVLYQREDLLARMLKMEDGGGGSSGGTVLPQPVGHVPAVTADNNGTADSAPPDPAVSDHHPEPTPTSQTVNAEDLLKEDPSPLTPSEDAAQRLMAEIPMSYGTASRPGFADLRATPGIADLPHKFLPSPGSPRNRLVVVGDVHGQLSALRALLERVEFKKKTDHLILTGDMISKGPDSSGVVQLAMDLGASAVRGNHEDRVLLAHREAVAKSSSSAEGGEKGNSSWLASIFGTTSSAGSDETPKPEPEPNPGTEADVAVARSLGKAQLKWLAGLPVILRLGPLEEKSKRPWNAGAVVVVHAGLVPGVPLERQDLRAAMNMRSLVYPAEGVRRDRVREQLEEDLKARIEKTSRGRKVEGHLEIKEEQVDSELKRLGREMGFHRNMDRRVWFPVDGRDGEPWSEVWSRYMSGKEEERDRMVVVYGHDAKAGLRVEGVEEETKPEGWTPDITGKKKRAERYAFGLDSGCVYGNQLTALVLEMGSDGGVGHRIVQVDCEKAAEIKA